MERRMLTHKEVLERKAVIRALSIALLFCTEEDASLIKLFIGRSLKDLNYGDNFEKPCTPFQFREDIIDHYFEEALKNAESCN